MQIIKHNILLVRRHEVAFSYLNHISGSYLNIKTSFIKWEYFIKCTYLYITNFMIAYKIHSTEVSWTLLHFNIYKLRERNLESHHLMAGPDVNMFMLFCIVNILNVRNLTDSLNYWTKYKLEYISETNGQIVCYTISNTTH